MCNRVIALGYLEFKTHGEPGDVIENDFGTVLPIFKENISHFDPKDAFSAD